jgi:hypothetical protein
MWGVAAMAVDRRVDTKIDMLEKIMTDLLAETPYLVKQL